MSSGDVRNEVHSVQKQMRIVQVLHSHGYGGAERHALSLMQGLQDRGHVVAFAGPRDSWLAERCEVHGIEVHHLPMAGMYDLFSFVSLRRFVHRWRADIVHGHLLRGARYAGVSAGNAVAVCTAHATTARKHMGRCRQIIAVSGAVRNTLRSAGYPDERISVIHNGVPDVPGGDRDYLREELGIAPGALAVFNAGRFIRDKGQDLLVTAVNQLTNVTLYLAGEPATPFGKDVMALAADNPRIHFLGYRDDIQRLLPAFDCYVSASRRESFGLSLVEAFAAGIPVVATRVGGVPEVVDDGGTGVLVAQEDPRALAHALEHIVANSYLLKSLGMRARAKYLECFSLDGMVDGIEALYRQLLRDRRG